MNQVKPFEDSSEGHTILVSFLYLHAYSELRDPFYGPQIRMLLTPHGNTEEFLAEEYDEFMAVIDELPSAQELVNEIALSVEADDELHERIKFTRNIIDERQNDFLNIVSFLTPNKDLQNRSLQSCSELAKIRAIGPVETVTIFICVVKQIVCIVILIIALVIIAGVVISRRTRRRHLR